MQDVLANLLHLGDFELERAQKLTERNAQSEFQNAVAERNSSQHAHGFEPIVSVRLNFHGSFSDGLPDSRFIFVNAVKSKKMIVP